MAINVAKLNDYLSGNKDAVETILEEVGCENIRFNSSKREFRCSREEGKNPSAVRIKVDSLRFKCFSTNEQGSLFNLIMSKRNCSFPKALQWVVDTLGLEKEEFNGSLKLPFDGFYKQIIKDCSEPEFSQHIYPNEILKKYGSVSHLSFLKDGIDLKVQEKFKLGYDIETSRITIPQWDVNGNLVGIMGRSNDPQIPYEYRWMPVIPCARSYTLFGYHTNYAKIQQQQLAIVTESEKGVMQLASMGYDYGLATCTKSISSIQAKYLKALRAEKIIIAYDEGVTEGELIFEAEKIKIYNPLIENKVGYIFDKNGDILPHGTKLSPTDIGKSALNELVQKYVKWI